MSYFFKIVMRYYYSKDKISALLPEKQVHKSKKKKRQRESQSLHWFTEQFIFLGVLCDSNFEEKEY